MNAVKKWFSFPAAEVSFGSRTVQQARKQTQKPLLWLCVAVVLILSYAFFLVHPSLSADDTAFARYYEQGEILLQGHFTTFLLQKFFPVIHFQSLYMDFVCLLLMTGAALLWTGALYQAAGERWNQLLFPVFPCVFLSYSLISEIFIYMRNSLDIGLGYFLSVLALLLGFEFVLQKQSWNGRCTAAALCLCFALASYESFAVVYLTGVLCLLFLDTARDEQRRTVGDCVGVCLRSGLVLLVGLILRAIFSRIMLLANAGLLAGRSNASANTVQWLSEGLGGVPRKFLGLLVYLFLDFLLPVLASLPIRELIVSMAILLVAACLLARARKQPTLILTSVLLCAVQFALGIIQGPTEDGTVQPYRTCQSFALFIGFVVLVCAQLLAARPGKWWGRGSVLVVVWLVGLQCFDLNSRFFADYQRYAYEAELMDSVALELDRNYAVAEKPVVFVGEVELPQSVVAVKYAPDDGPELALANRLLTMGGKEPLEHFPVMQSMPNSVINWSIPAWYDQNPNEQTYLLFTYQGHDYLPCTVEQYLDGRQKAEIMPDWPKSGSVSDEGDYILVKF